MQGTAMTEGAPWRHILRFALPVFAGSLLQQLYSTVDTIIVGNFCGEDALSAVGTTGSFTFLFLAIALGISQGNGVVVAQCFGAGNEERVRTGASTGLVLMAALGIASTALGIIVARPAFVHLVAVPPELIDLTLLYFRIYMAGIIFQFGYNAYAAILRSVGDSAATLYFLLISSLLNIGLDLFFVAALDWGVAGAAIATCIAQAGSFAAALAYAARRYPVFRFKLSELSFDAGLARETVVAGLPIVLQLSVVSFGLTFIQRAVNEFGKEMTASFTVGQRIENYIGLPCSAFQSTLATFTGQNIGAGKMERVRRGAIQAVALSFTMTLVISILIWFFTDEIISWFALGAESIIYCRQHLRAIALVNIILSLYIPLFGVFQGSNHSLAVTAVAVGALGMRVLATYLFRYGPLFGHTIIWWNGLFGFGMGFTIAWTYYLSGRWRRNATISH